jgi:hypothetical protein
VFKIEWTRAFGQWLNALLTSHNVVSPRFRPQRGDGTGHMKEHAEEWKNLCEQAAVEQDPQKLLVLTQK